MGSEELYHLYSTLEYEKRLPKQLKNLNKLNEEENYRQGTKQKVPGLGNVNKGRKHKKTGN